MYKTCTRCKKELPLSSFHKESRVADGRRAECKACNRNRVKEHGRTKEGMILRRYRAMKDRVEGRDPKAVSSVGKPILPKEEFINWALNNDDFHELFKKWEDSGYQHKYTPSIDRIDERFGYELFNMQFITQGENTRRANIFRHYNKVI